MLLAGVSLWYFMAGISSIAGLVYAVIISRGTEFQILKNYQYQRIETFLDPSSDPLGTGYPHNTIKNCVRIWWLFWSGFHARHAKPIKFSTRKAYRFYLYNLCRRIWVFGRYNIIIIIHSNYFFLLFDSYAKP